MTEQEQIIALAELDGCKKKSCPCGCGSVYFEHPVIYGFDASESQLCEALLRATGKWKD